MTMYCHRRWLPQAENSNWRHGAARGGISIPSTDDAAPS